MFLDKRKGPTLPVRQGGGAIGQGEGPYTCLFFWDVQYYGAFTSLGIMGKTFYATSESSRERHLMKL